MFRAAAVLTFAAAAAAGCASPPAAPSSSAPAAVDLRRFGGSDGGMRFVSLEPLRVGTTPTLTEERVQLGVGALYGGPPEGGDGPHTLALVLTVVSSDGTPLLSPGCGLLLEVDGTRLASDPAPGGHIYSVEQTLEGVRETVMVPLGPDRMRRLAEAEVVRGRLGPWFSFLLPPDQRRALLRILDEIPDDAVFRHSLDRGGMVASL